MPSCSVCTHPERRAIDQRLVAGGSERAVAGQFGLARSAVDRHRRHHLQGRLVRKKEATDATQLQDFLQRVEHLQQKVLSVLEAVEKEQRYPIILAAIREARANIELLARLSGELQASETHVVVLAAEQIQAVILPVLSPYPDAKLAVMRALEGIGNGSTTATHPALNR